MMKVKRIHFYFNIFNFVTYFVWHLLHKKKEIALSIIVIKKIINEDSQLNALNMPEAIIKAI